MKELVIVYSNGGVAYDIAKTYAEKANAPLHRIEPKWDPKGFWAYPYWGYKASLRRSTRLKPDHLNLTDYDSVTLYCPIHAGVICAPVRSFIFSHRTELPPVNLVLTHRAVDNDYVDAAQALEKELIWTFASIDSMVVK